MKNEIIFRQLFEPETSTYTYLLADPETKEAVLIDTVLETVDRDMKLMSELGLKLKYILDTHIHADHITGSGELRKLTNAKSAVSQSANVDCVDIPLDNEQELQFGNYKITALATPGHTNSCMSFYCDGKVFTGDALLIRGTGRTDFQMGSSSALFDSVHKQLFKLPKDTKVYPGHDYRGHTVSTIDEEMRFNPRIGVNKSKDEFIKTMSELKLANPKKIHEAVPANLGCGKKNSVEERLLHPQTVDGVPEVTPEKVSTCFKNLLIVDVRRPEEFNNELGHIPNARLVTLGDSLQDFLRNADKSEEIVFVCRSGARSGQATLLSKQMGFKFSSNMTGGMIRWNELGYVVERK
jgi:glyoxylase-like metal-dependent hydrolase (beta-lactamase superfamily II)/rhodanese-related sulfurtransferase